MAHCKGALRKKVQHFCLVFFSQMFTTFCVYLPPNSQCTNLTRISFKIAIVWECVVVFWFSSAFDWTAFCFCHFPPVSLCFPPHLCMSIRQKKAPAIFFHSSWKCAPGSVRANQVEWANLRAHRDVTVNVQRLWILTENKWPNWALLRDISKHANIIYWGPNRYIL